MASPRVLFSTIPVEVLKNENKLKGRIFDTTSSYQSWTAMNIRPFQLVVANPAFGLRFIKENIKSVDILEYPTWDEYKAALERGYDIVGISFFTWTVTDALKMIEMARENKVGEIWGGNYGVMTPEVNQYFDKAIAGNCEAFLKKEIEGIELSTISHPVIIGKVKWPFYDQNVGYLYTKRGCKAKCAFCPTPWFTSEDNEYDIFGINRVLDSYRKLNVSSVVIFDETFLDKKHQSEIVIEEMARRNLNWVCLTRADRIVGKVSKLKQKGLHSAIIGVESIRDNNLSFVHKKEKSALIKEVIMELRGNQCFPVGTYMLGFPDDTAVSIKEDIDELASWGFFLMQFTILTPYPGTPLWQQLRDKITDLNWKHYDSYHLVWDHPYLTPHEGRELLYYALKKINKPFKYIRKILKYFIQTKIFHFY